ncbi:MAG: hypothetical protein WKG07_04280 [Hymenobacter sp.]
MTSPGRSWLFDAPTPGRLLATPPATTTFRTGQLTAGRLAHGREVKQQLRKALVAHRDEQLRDPKIQQIVKGAWRLYAATGGSV